MKILSVKNNKTFVSFEIELDSKKWKDSFAKTKANIVKNIQIQGFRKGHAPQSEIDKRVSRSDIAMRALDKEQNSIVQQIVESNEFKKESCLDSVNRMEITKLEPTPVLRVSFDAIPEITGFTTKDVKEITLPPFKAPEVSEQTIKQQIKMMIKPDAMVSTKKSGVVAKGDIAVIDFKGFIDGKAFKGGQGSNYELEIGSKSFIDNFEDQLIGCKKGDKKDVNVKFPKDYGMKDYAGKPAKFEVEIKDVKEIEYPKITKEYCKKFMMDCSNEKELHDHLKDLFIQEAQTRYQDNAVRIINDSISKKAKLNYYPQGLIAIHKNQIIRQYEQEAARSGFKSLDAYKSALRLDQKQFENALENSAKVTMAVTLVYEKLIESYKLKATEADIKEYQSKLARYLGNEKQAKEVYEKNKDYAESNIVRDKLIKKLIEECKKEEPKKAAR